MLPNTVSMTFYGTKTNKVVSKRWETQISLSVDEGGGHIGFQTRGCQGPTFRPEEVVFHMKQLAVDLENLTSEF